MARLSIQQIDRMRAQGLTDDKIHSLAGIKKYELPKEFSTPFATQRLETNRLAEAQGGTDTRFRDLPENILGSAGRLVKDVGSAIIHPVRTVKGVGKIVKAGGAKLAQGVDKLLTGEAIDTEDTRTADAVGRFFADRYGSAENLKQTIINDPAGVALDLSALFTGGGSLATKVGTQGGKLAKAGEVATRVGQAVEPVSLFTKGVGKGVEFATKGRTLGVPKSKVDLATKAIAEKRGVELPASALTDSGAVPAVEALASKGIFGGEITKRTNRAFSKMNDIADDLVRKSGGDTDPAILGKQILESTNEYRKTYFDVKSDLYKNAKIPERGKGAILIEGSNFGETRGLLDSIVKQKTRAGKILGQSRDSALFNQLKSALSKDKLNARVVADSLKELGERLTTSSDPVITGNQATLRKIMATMDNELDTAVKASNPELAKLIDEANSFYRQGLDTLNSTFGKNVKRLEDQPSRIMDTIANKTLAPEDVPKIIEMVGQENLKSIQANVIQDIFQRAKNVDGNFTPAGIEKAIQTYGREKLSAILGSDQMKVVDDLSELSRSLGKASKITGGSQTAFIGRVAAETALLFSNPLLALKVILGDAVFSKFIASPSGQKFLTEGVTFTGKTADKIGGIGERLPIEALFQTGRLGEIGGQEN